MLDQYDRQTIKEITTQYPKDKVVLFCLRISKELDAENTKLIEDNEKAKKKIFRDKINSDRKEDKLRSDIRSLRKQLQTNDIKYKALLNKVNQLEVNNNRLKTELSLTKKPPSPNAPE